MLRRVREFVYYWKCRLWRRYNVVRVRTLPPTWSDRCEILPHAMFQILVDFIDQECSPGIVDWDADETHRAVMAELRDHYRWWKDVYLRFDAWEGFDESRATPWDERFEPDGHGAYTLREPSEYEREFYDVVTQREQEMDVELERRLCRIVVLRPYLWT